MHYNSDSKSQAAAWSKAQVTNRRKEVPNLNTTFLQQPGAVLAAGVLSYMAGLLEVDSDPQWTVRVLTLLVNTLTGFGKTSNPQNAGNRVFAMYSSLSAICRLSS